MPACPRVYAAGVRDAAVRRRRTTSQTGSPSTSGHRGEGQQRADHRGHDGEQRPHGLRAAVEPGEESRRPLLLGLVLDDLVGGDVDGDGRQRRLVGQPRLLGLQGVQLGLSAGELRLDPDDVLEVAGVGEQQLHAPQAGLLRADAGAVVDDLGGDVLGAAVGGAQHPDLLQRGHRLAELPARHPHHHPHVGGVALGVGLGGLVGDLAALRVDDALHVLAGRPDVLAGERDGAVGDDRALQLRGGRAVLPARRVGRPGRRRRPDEPPASEPPGRAPDELPDVLAGRLARDVPGDGVAAAVVGGAGGQQGRHGEGGEESRGAGRGSR